MSHPFDIRFLDHVAIYVKDMRTSIKWYQEVLGLKKYKIDAWGDFPVFMLCGKSGLAIFPADLDHAKTVASCGNVKVGHFAFNVTNENFEIAQDHLKSLNIAFDYQDHEYFHSIYLIDPDGHKLELTTIMVEEEKFY